MNRKSWCQSLVQRSCAGVLCGKSPAPCAALCGGLVRRLFLTLFLAYQKRKECIIEPTNLCVHIYSPNSVDAWGIWRVFGTAITCAPFRAIRRGATLTQTTLLVKTIYFQSPSRLGPWTPMIPNGFKMISQTTPNRFEDPQSALAHAVRRFTLGLFAHGSI